jgi:ADP-ribose 1''-phosphate phosphatase
MPNNDFTIAEVAIKIKDLPPGSFLVHATNCLAIWGSGFAAEMSYMFPAAYEQYRIFCNAAKADPSHLWAPQSLAGKCFIIPPQERDIQMGAPSVHVVCLFTSHGYGRPNKANGKPGVDRMSKILEQTNVALADFRRQLEETRGRGEVQDIVIYSPRFNSGAFRVPWDQTQVAVHDMFRDFACTWNFMAPP